jgi:hypothetical protein
MFAILAAICFGLAFFFHGGQLTIHSAWFDPTGLLYLGLTFLAIHLIPTVATRARFWK